MLGLLRYRSHMFGIVIAEPKRSVASIGQLPSPIIGSSPGAELGGRDG